MVRKVIFPLLITAFFLASCYSPENKNSDIFLEIKELLQRAEQKDVTAQYELATKLFTGEEVFQNKEESLKWFIEAANNGLPEAQYTLGALYEEGDLISPDPIKSLFWHEKAARGGITESQYIVGIVYFEGKDVPRDLIKSFVWLETARKHGVAEAGPLLIEIKNELSFSDQKKAQKFYEQITQEISQSTSPHP